MKKTESLIFFLTLLFLPTQLGKHFWPQFSFIYSLPIDYLSPTVYFWDLLVIFLMFFLFKQKKINTLALNIFLLFILTQVVSLLQLSSTSLNIGAGLVRVEQYFISGFLGVYLASKNINESKDILFWGLTLGILGESVLAILQFFKGGTIGLWILGERSFSLSTPAIAKFDFYGVEFLRPYGTFPHPNVLAAFMVITGLLLLWFNKKEKISLLVGIPVLLTVSRAAIIAGFFSLLFLLDKKGRILLIGVMIILLPILYTRFFSVFNFDNVSFLRREQLTEVAVTIFAKSPLTGVGVNNFIPNASDQLLIGPSRFLQPVHNVFLLSLAETGIIGFSGLMIFFGYPILKIIKLKKLLLIWVAVIFLGLFDHYFLTLPQGYRLLFVLWGISLSTMVVPEKQRKD